MSALCLHAPCPFLMTWKLVCCFKMNRVAVSFYDCMNTSNDFGQMSFSTQVCTSAYGTSAGLGSGQGAFINFQQQFPCRWLRGIVCSEDSPARGAGGCHLFHWLFHFLPWVSAQVFMLTLSVSRCFRSLAVWQKLRTKFKGVQHCTRSFCCCFLLKEREGKGKCFDSLLCSQHFEEFEKSL